MIVLKIAIRCSPTSESLLSPLTQHLHPPRGVYPAFTVSVERRVLND